MDQDTICTILYILGDELDDLFPDLNSLELEQNKELIKKVAVLKSIANDMIERLVQYGYYSLSYEYFEFSFLFMFESFVETSDNERQREEAILMRDSARSICNKIRGELYLWVMKIKKWNY